MPIKAHFTYICDTCGRATKSYGRPEYWEVEPLFKVFVRCPICIRDKAKEDYEQAQKAVVAYLKQEGDKTQDETG